MTKSRMVPLNAVGPARGPTIKELLTYVACQGSSFSRSGDVEVSGPTGNGCVTCAALQPETSPATAAALARPNIVRMETINRVAHHNRVAALDPKIE